MTPAPDLAAWGIEPGYHDYAGHWRAIPEQTAARVLEAMGAQEAAPASAGPLVATGRHGPWPQLSAGGLKLEDGSVVEIGDDGGGFPSELPFGYHLFTPADGGRPTTIAVCPDQCPSPPPGRTWGWAVQLYAARSESSWGIGDFADLRRLAAWASQNGASFVLVNPLHAPAPGPHRPIAPTRPVLVVSSTLFTYGWRTCPGPATCPSWVPWPKRAEPSTTTGS